MKLLQELLKLREHTGPSEPFTDLDIWQSVGSKSDLDSADVDVFYDYEAASHDDHPYGSGTAREHHPAQIQITAVVLAEDADRFDEDGEVIGKLKEGTDLMSQPWWDDKWNDWLAEKIGDKIDKNRDDDFDVPDDDDF